MFCILNSSHLWRSIDDQIKEAEELGISEVVTIGKFHLVFASAGDAYFSKC